MIFQKFNIIVLRRLDSSLTRAQ